MQDNNQKETMSNDDVVVPTTDVPQSEPVVPETPVTNMSDTTDAMSEMSTTMPESTVGAVAATPVAGGKKNVYVWSVLAILVILAGLTFFLEKEGRISTGIFSGIIEGMKSSGPVATVNGVEIARKDYDSSLQQLLQIASTQGVNTSDPAVTEQYKTQAIDTLVNGELLRQEALNAGMEATEEDIEARFSQIRDGIGGQEALDAKMLEFGINEESLRKDIENEILIQGLFDSIIDPESAEVTDAEISEYYDKVGGEAAGLPPLAEVSTQIEEQIKLDRQQAEIGAYLESAKEDAEIEILI